MKATLNNGNLLRLFLQINLSSEEQENIPMNANIFSHPAWHKTIAAAYGFKPYYIMLENHYPKPATCVLPVMQVNSRSWVSLPFTDCSIRLMGDADNLAELTDALNLFRKSVSAKTMEIRWSLSAGKNAFLGEKFYWHTTVLSPDSELVFKCFKRTQVQQCIRRAEKEGVTLRMGTTWDDVRLFYKLHLNNRRRLGVPIQPLHYFRGLWENLINQGLGFIIFAYHEKQLLAGAVFLHWNHTLTYKYSASDPRFWKLRPNNLVLWEAIRWGCENGYHVFDWGRTDMEDEGLRDFKLGWGSEEKILQYTILADRPPPPSGQGMLRKAMKIVIQGSPLFVCQVKGEMFYRFAA